MSNEDLQSDFHVAEFNIGRLKHPVGDPRIESFVSQLDEINRLADRSPGFIWRLKAEEQGGRVIQAYEDPLIIVNLSVWESIEALEDYTYQTAHRQVLHDRRQWFQPLQGPSLVLWWIPAGQLPSAAQGRQKLEQLEREGASPQAFTFRNRYPPPPESRAKTPSSLVRRDASGVRRLV